ncbi:hypothetical protein POTOM_028688 [Populus tomentosa]|uniref:Uncharacterized protein n=1 Tax=Populus tomentosa TaxID=118781 RepID=A0A8X7Z9H3_POPTO|nr:hypothetical protein POTOM_028688 [Populus tomentosa]
MAGFNCFFILTLFIIALLVSGGQEAHHLLQFPPLPFILNLFNRAFGNMGEPYFLKKLIFLKNLQCHHCLVYQHCNDPHLQPCQQLNLLKRRQLNIYGTITSGEFLASGVAVEECVEDDEGMVMTGGIHMSSELDMHGGSGLCKS